MNTTDITRKIRENGWVGIPDTDLHHVYSHTDSNELIFVRRGAKNLPEETASWILEKSKTKSIRTMDQIGVLDRYPDTYVYPAVFGFSPDRPVSVYLPDFNIYTCSKENNDEMDAFLSAKDLLTSIMLYYEKNDWLPPNRTPIESIRTIGNSKTTLIEVFMPVTRLKFNSDKVPVTINLPRWLDEVSKENKIELGELLYETLFEKFSKLKKGHNRK